MINVNPGEKIIDSCLTFECNAYPYVIALSNIGELRSKIKCPQVFCDRMKKAKFTCEKCNKEKAVLLGTFINDRFFCYSCLENRNEVETKQHEDTEEKHEIQINTQIDERIEEIMKYMSIILPNHTAYVEVQGSGISLFNPMNDLSMGSMLLKNEDIQRISMDEIKQTLNKFFKSFIDHLDKEKNTCSDCKYRQTYPNNLVCTDCTKNEYSASLNKYDRHANI